VSTLQTPANKALVTDGRCAPAAHRRGVGRAELTREPTPPRARSAAIDPTCVAAEAPANRSEELKS
jgi:hypothetical protein